jgi:flagellar hook protein FlgE
MLRSFFAGVSGLRAQQQMMDVIGNNIANVNTNGYKSSSVQFADLLSQMTNGASVPTATQGGTNPTQIGLGVTVAGVIGNFNQGAMQYTGRSTDLALQGDGFFMANQGGQTLYTRAGTLTLDAQGNLVTPTGGILQGWTANPLTHAVNSNGPAGNLTIPAGQVLPPQATQNVTVGGDLPANATAPQTGPPAVPGTVIDTGVTVYDKQGTAIPLTLEFSFQGSNTWQVVAKDATGATISGSTKTLAFNPATGQLSPAVAYSFTPNTGVWSAPLNIGFGSPNSPNALVQFAGQSSVNVSNRDGSAIGTLETFNVGQDGTLTGTFTNGMNIALGQVAVANFNNPAGLEKVGGSMFRESLNSGPVLVGAAGSGGRGLITAGSLEMSNVDLAQEFTSLIIAQRGFQANSRVITTSDQVLQALVTMQQ